MEGRDGIVFAAGAFPAGAPVRDLWWGAGCPRKSFAAGFDVPLPQLSIGMTGDFVVAIEEGATLVRVGTAIFGQRTPMRKRTQAAEDFAD